jgi:hypothetical protein
MMHDYLGVNLTMPDKTYCQRLVEAEEEEEVTAVIENIQHAYDVEWVPIGRQENNYGVVESQASSPLGALTELISNSIDAVLRKRYRDLYGSEYDPSHDLQSYSEAANKLLTDADEKVTVRADGQLPQRGGSLNLTVKDTGEGQTPKTFEDTFVGLLKPGMSKQGWPFLQGQFGMGSTAVLPHCGVNGYKLICSAGMENPGKWSWTIVRKNKPGNAYEYLRVDGEVPQFEGEFQDRTVGSIIKLYNYEFGSKSNITNYFRYDLARVITESPVPIHLEETRYDNRSQYNAHVVGLKTLIDRHSEYVKSRQTVQYDFGPPLGEREVEIVIFKDDETVKNDDGLKLRDGKQRMFVSRRKQENRSIFFTVNGQVHGDLGLSFVKNRCDRYHTGKDLMAFVDFSDLGPAELTDLFKPSRDRLTDKPTAQRLKDGMENLIKTDPVVEEEEKRRREQFTKEKREEKLGNMLEELVDRNPQLLDYLQEGSRINKVDTGEQKNGSDYTAPFIPDKFKIITSKLGGEYEFWEKQENYTIEVPVNRNSWVRFFLNAPNDFFSRENRCGFLTATPQECVRSWGLSDGQLSVQLRPLPNVEAGTSYPMTIKVGADGMEPLQQQFTLRFTEEVDGTSTSQNDDVPPIESLEFPEIQTVNQDDWDSHWGDWDEQTPVQIEGTKSENMTIWVNYDAGPLLNFMSRHNLRKTGKETIKETWKAGVAIYTVSTYLELKTEFEEEDINTREIAAVSMKGVTQSMLDQHISTEELENLTV